MKVEQEVFLTNFNLFLTENVPSEVPTPSRKFEEEVSHLNFQDTTLLTLTPDLAACQRSHYCEYRLVCYLVIVSGKTSVQSKRYIVVNQKVKPTDI